MISRRTASALGSLYEKLFREFHSYPNRSGGYYIVDDTALYDFLYEHNYQAWFCNAAKSMGSGMAPTRLTREFVMKLHTGETQASATSSWSWREREKLGQEYLLNLTTDVLNYLLDNADLARRRDVKGEADAILSSLELDGYVFENRHFLIPESDVLDVKEETGVLESLYKSLKLANFDMAFNHLRLSEEHYMAGRWGDTISNARNFLECVLREAATRHSHFVNKSVLPEHVYSQPREVRGYLMNAELLEEKEAKAIAAVYGLLSETGSHPNMAQKDQARLLRQMALSWAQFVMLRLQGAVK